MSRCKHGVDFAEYTHCAECANEEIISLESEVDTLIAERDAYRTELATANALLGKTGYMCPVCNNPVSSVDKGCVYCELKTAEKRVAELDGVKDENRKLYAKVLEQRDDITQLEEAKKEREKLQKVVEAAKSQFTPCITDTLFIYCSDCCSKKLCAALRNLDSKTSS